MAGQAPPGLRDWIRDPCVLEFAFAAHQRHLSVESEDCFVDLAIGPDRVPAKPQCLGPGGAGQALRVSAVDAHHTAARTHGVCPRH
jgi:hypothetical protein